MLIQSAYALGADESQAADLRGYMREESRKEKKEDLDQHVFLVDSKTSFYVVTRPS